MQKHTISLCMIVKNEEKYLDRCLKSVQGKVDEIIVVDTGSTDNTFEIAKKHNAIIKLFDWIDDFAAARNYSISEAKGEYILVLDADEYFDDSVDLQKELQSHKDFYKINIKNYQSDGRVVFHQNVRIFKSGIGLKYRNKLHESLNTYDEGTKYIGADTDIVLHHVGYLAEVIKEKDKKKRNYDIMVRELHDNPTGFAYYNMGLTYINNENYDKALDMFKKAYPMSKNKEYVKGMLVRMGECLSLLNRANEGIKLLSDAINVFNDYTDLHYTLGRLFKDCGYLRDAEIEFRECLRLGEKFENLTVEGVGSYMANYNLAVIYEMEGKIGDAFEEAYKAITKKRSFTPALSLYIKLMHKAGIQPEKITEHLNQVYRIQTTEDLKSMVYSLYEIRNPILGKFDYILNSEQLTEIKAVALMLDKQYDKSLEEWKRIDNISPMNVMDAAALCMFSKSRLMLDKLKEALNFSSKEWKTVSGILLGESIDKLNLTLDVENLLLRLSEYLINISEFDYFEYVSIFLLQCSAETQEKLVPILLDYGHADTALELLGQLTEKYPQRFECNVLTGDAYMKKNNLSKAAELYARSLSLKDDYSTYEKIYNIYEKMGASENLNGLLDIMKRKYSLSIWLQRA